jgi:hypothetical protein
MRCVPISLGSGYAFVATALSRDQPSLGGYGSIQDVTEVRRSIKVAMKVGDEGGTG